MRKQAASGWQRAITTGRFWTEAEAREALAERRRSGESVVAFARRHGISAKRLYWWRHQLKTRTTKAERGNDAPREAVARLIPVTVRPVPNEAQANEGVVVTDGELRVEVGVASAVSPTWIATLLRLVRESGT